MKFCTSSPILILAFLTRFVEFLYLEKNIEFLFWTNEQTSDKETLLIEISWCEIHLGKNCSLYEWTLGPDLCLLKIRLQCVHRLDPWSGMFWVKWNASKSMLEPVYQKSVVQDMVVVVKGTHLVALKAKNTGWILVEWILIIRFSFSQILIGSDFHFVRFNLDHLVRPPLPSQPFIVSWFLDLEYPSFIESGLRLN